MYHQVKEMCLNVKIRPESEYSSLFTKLHTEVVLTKLIPQHDLDYINWNKWIASKIKGKFKS